MDAVTARSLFDQIGDDLAATHEEVQSKPLFGMPCHWVKGKAFVSIGGDSMVFKLRGTAHARALALPGAHLSDPSGKGRPMREWVVVPFASAEEWLALAEEALHSVAG